MVNMIKYIGKLEDRFTYMTTFDKYGFLESWCIIESDGTKLRIKDRISPEIAMLLIDDLLFNRPSYVEYTRRGDRYLQSYAEITSYVNLDIIRETKLNKLLND